jgi:hypothetical protein
MSAAGTGLTGIARALNAEHVPTPRPQQGRPAAWARRAIASPLALDGLERRLREKVADWRGLLTRNAIRLASRRLDRRASHGARVCSSPPQPTR